MLLLLIPFTSYADQYRAKVIKVIDGDTIWVKTKNKHIKIRLVILMLLNSNKSMV